MKVDFKNGNNVVTYLQGTSRTDRMKTHGKLISGDILVQMVNSEPMTLSDVASSSELASLEVATNKGKTYKYTGPDTSTLSLNHVYMITGDSTHDDCGAMGTIVKTGTGCAFRDYVPDIISVLKPSQLTPSADYTGDTITNGYTKPTGVIVSGNESGVSGGTYTAVYSLEPRYIWSDGTTDSVTVVLTINYVWNRYAVSYNDNTLTFTSNFWNEGKAWWVLLNLNPYIDNSSSAPLIDTTTGLYRFSSIGGRFTYSGTNYKTESVTSSNRYTGFPHSDSALHYDTAEYFDSSSLTTRWWEWNTGGWGGLWAQGVRHYITSTRGAYEAEVRHTSSTAYPSDGILDGKWYTRIH